ncbi:aryl-sulfate sulfotransferase N-terminal domain-containing protein, partial [Kluyvera intermedia]|uniref:aryl-sulfate sulfotransferase N-terminal domain-containing protein n=1 Tax=Kluyvera intermedia TaxID=61648 RepID=UPI001F3500FC
AMVMSHTNIYQDYLSQVMRENTLENVLVIPDPFGTAPLSAWIGVWSLEVRDIALQIQDVAKSASLIEQTITLEVGANLVPVLG